MSDKIISEDQLRLKECEDMYANLLQRHNGMRRENLEQAAQIKVLESRGDSTPQFLTAGVSRDLSRLRLYDGSKVLKGTYLCYMDRWNAWFDVVVRGKGRTSDQVRAPYFKLLAHAAGYGTR